MSQPQSSPTETKLAPVSMGRQGVELRDMDSLARLANMIVAGGYAPKGDSAAGVAVKIQLGLELGLPPMAALSRICVINGRPSIFGDAGKALLMASGLLDGAWRISWTGTEGKDDRTCTVRMKRRGMDGEFVGVFSVGQAKKAGLWGKAGPWQTHPDRQMEWRAWWYAARDGFADVLGGIASAEESLDLPSEPAKVADAEPRPTTLDGLAKRMTVPEAIVVMDAIRTESITEQTAAMADPQTQAAVAQLSGVMDSDELTEFIRTAPAQDGEGPSDRWKASADLELETPIPVKLGAWESWCDLEVPKGSALYKACHAKGAPTWRTAAQGKKAGGRHALLLDVVTKALSMDGSTWEQTPSQNHQRAACALVMLLHGAAGTEEPKQEGALFP